jgi:hypothetical protein
LRERSAKKQGGLFSKPGFVALRLQPSLFWVTAGAARVESLPQTAIFTIIGRFSACLTAANAL